MISYGMNLIPVIIMWLCDISATLEKKKTNLSEVSVTFVRTLPHETGRHYPFKTGRSWQLYRFYGKGYKAVAKALDILENSDSEAAISEENESLTFSGWMQSKLLLSVRKEDLRNIFIYLNR